MRIFFAWITLILSTFLWAHGMDKLGPHGGFVRMPGNFHTEIKDNKNGFQIWLLDMKFQNPTILNSSAELEIKQTGKTIKINCTSEKDYFFCPYTHNRKVIKSLNVKSKRNNSLGQLIEYIFPLKLKK